MKTQLSNGRFTHKTYKIKPFSMIQDTFEHFTNQQDAIKVSRLNKIANDCETLCNEYSKGLIITERDIARNYHSLIKLYKTLAVHFNTATQDGLLDNKLLIDALESIKQHHFNLASLHGTMFMLGVKVEDVRKQNNLALYAGAVETIKIYTLS